MNRSLQTILLSILLGVFSLQAQTPHVVESATNDNLKQEFAKHTIASTLGFLTVTENTFPLLHKTVAEYAAKIAIPTPKIYIFKGNLLSRVFEELGIDFRCNAFATSISHSKALICIGDDLLSALSDSEMTAVIAHELGHVKANHTRKKVAVALLLYAISSYIENNFAGVLKKGYTPFVQRDAHNNPVIGIIIVKELLLLSIAIKLATATLSQAYEVEADTIAAEVLDDPKILGAALDHIGIVAQDKPRLITWLMNFFESHPTTGDRKRMLAKIAEKKNIAA